MKLYQVEMKLCATAYIKASSKQEALAKAQALKDLSPTILDHYADVPVSGLDFDNPDLPEISLSPAMCIHGPWDDHVELAASSVPLPETAYEKAARAQGWTQGGDNAGVIYSTKQYDSWKEAVSWSGTDSPNNNGPVYDTWKECCEAEGIEVAQ